MNTKPLAKALTKHVYSMGGPVKLWLPVYLIAAFLWIVTSIWGFVILAILWHVVLKFQFDRDEYWMKYFLQSFTEEQYLEP